MFYAKKKREEEHVSEALHPSVVAMLEPQPEAPIVGIPVMERAKSAISPYAPEEIDREFISSEIVRLTHERQLLYGIELAATTMLNNKIAELSRVNKRACCIDKISFEKKILSPEVLTWRKSQGIPYKGQESPVPQPEVGLFGLDTPHLSMSNHGSWDPSLPPSLAALYDDVKGALWQLDKNGYMFEYNMTATFSGLIPAETKEKIQEARKSNAFTQIRLLAETDWSIVQLPNPLYADPIVVGLIDDEMWVIDVFDPTPLEDYIAKEFTT